MTIYCRGIRGATTATANTREAILEATRDMLVRLIEANDLRPDDIASAIFSTTLDLNAEFPAVAARELGWLDTALFCTHEMAVPGSLPRCIRVLIHWNTTRRADEIVHVYIREASTLRPERAVLQSRIVDPFEVVASNNDER
ncbi:MAG TPA: chorismate mutase [Roseiflexaceae bacterium]|nr:chorismate mutase [Roseiflexaceae bacterium]